MEFSSHALYILSGIALTVLVTSHYSLLGLVEVAFHALSIGRPLSMLQVDQQKNAVTLLKVTQLVLKISRKLCVPLNLIQFFIAHLFSCQLRPQTFDLLVLGLATGFFGGVGGMVKKI